MKGEWLYEQAITHELEGMVPKRADSVYQLGARSDDWLKVKRLVAVPAERFKR